MKNGTRRAEQYLPQAGFDWSGGDGHNEGEMIERAGEPEEPHVGIFWMIGTSAGQKLLTASCPLAEAEPYGDCLTFGPGHYQVWRNWRRTRELEAAARAIVREYEYEEWPRGRVVFDRAKERFVFYADKKLMAATTVARICERFRLSTDRVSVEGDTHYRSTEAI